MYAIRSYYELDFGLAEFRLVRGEDHVRHHCQFAAAAERKAVHRGNPGLAHPVADVRLPASYNFV